MTNRLNWTNRQGPGDFDVTAPQAVIYDFNHCRSTIPGTPSWPEKFGPANIRKAWKAGLVVVAEIEGFPHPVAVSEAKWTEFGKVLVVKTLEGDRVPNRIWTRPNTKGLMSTGELIESPD